MPQSKGHILRRFPKIGRKVIEYSYVSGQCRQTIQVNVLLNNCRQNVTSLSLSIGTTVVLVSFNGEEGGGVVK